MKTNKQHGTLDIIISSSGKSLVDNDSDMPNHECEQPLKPFYTGVVAQRYPCRAPKSKARSRLPINAGGGQAPHSSKCEAAWAEGCSPVEYMYAMSESMLVKIDMVLAMMTNPTT